jgi:plastocyanin
VICFRWEIVVGAWDVLSDARWPHGAKEEEKLHRLATIAVLGVAAISLLAAGCGDDDDDTAATTTPATTGATGDTGATGKAGGGNTVDISETDFALDPSEVTVKEGEVTFNVTNDGQAPHNLEIEGNGVEKTLPRIWGRATPARSS